MAFFLELAERSLKWNGGLGARRPNRRRVASFYMGCRGGPLSYWAIEVWFIGFISELRNTGCFRPNTEIRENWRDEGSPVSVLLAPSSDPCPVLFSDFFFSKIQKRAA